MRWVSRGLNPSYGFKPERGKMAYIIRGMFGKSEIGYSEDDYQTLHAFFEKSIAYPGTIVRASWHSGTWIPPEVIPRRVRLKKAKTMYDWMLLRGGGDLVSSRFRNAVEELDPGRHQFFPVVVEDKNGVARPDEFFMFNAVGRIDSIIEERSNLQASGRGHVECWGYSRRVGPWQCTLDAAVIGDRACWIEHRYSLRVFISDRLADLLKKRKLHSFYLDEHSEEVSR
jgi:hypothetical protein